MQPYQKEIYDKLRTYNYDIDRLIMFKPSTRSGAYAKAISYWKTSPKIRRLEKRNNPKR